MLKQITSEIKSELKISKIIGFMVMLIVVGYALNWLSKKNAIVASVNPLPLK